MVQLTLPKNSRIKKGKTWPKPEGANNLRVFNIYRWSPDDTKNPSLDTYFVDIDNCGPMILDALIKIKANDPQRKLLKVTNKETGSVKLKVVTRDGEEVKDVKLS